MNDTLTVFTSKEFGQVRMVLGDDGEPRFCLKDLCQPLGLATFKVMQRLGDNLLSKYAITDEIGRQRLMTFVNEEGLYDTILESRKPEARQFRHWITGEVLPAIRKYGCYFTDKAVRHYVDNPDEIHTLLNQLDVEKEARLEAEERASYVDYVLSCPDLVTINQIAQDYGMSAIAFNQMLHKFRIQYTCNKQWILYAEYKDKGYTHSHTHYFRDGRCYMHTRWTQSGRLFLYRFLKEVGILPLMESEAA